MPFQKQVKSNAYFSRYQTKYRRRQEGKTDYYARKRLITQAKSKYNAPKYRMVVRFTNRDIICQIVSSEIQGDRVLSAAYSHELRRYGIKHGLTNWAAAYSTGLLLARRTLSKLGLDESFEGVAEADGEYKITESCEHEGETRRPFKANLDVGLHRTSTGARVFGAMKGASDGGLYIPHSESRFPGFDIETKELDAEGEPLRYILAGHVSEYMETLADDDEERYKGQFGKYIDDGIDADGLEEVYQNAHEKIREDPNLPNPDSEGKDKEHWKSISSKFMLRKKTREQRREAVEAKIAEKRAS